MLQVGEMDGSEYYRTAGYQKGFEDATRTGGKITQKKIDRYLNAETRKLTGLHAQEFIEGWYKGFNDGAVESACKSAKHDVFWANNIYWENPLFKDR